MRLLLCALPTLFVSGKYPTELHARATSCGCEKCVVGLFEECVDTEFHGEWARSPLDVKVVDKPPPAIYLRAEMVATLRNCLESLRTPFLAMGYESTHQVRPTFLLIPGETQIEKVFKTVPLCHCNSA